MFCVAVFLGSYYLFKSQEPKTFRFENELYGDSEAIDIKKDDYERMISEKKSFVVMVDKPDFYTTADMCERMASFPEDMQFKYYRIMWGEAKESSIHDYVKFVPSVVIVRKGEVVDFLDADSDDDTPKYNEAQAYKIGSRAILLFRQSLDEDMMAQKKARVKRDFLIKDGVLP